MEQETAPEEFAPRTAEEQARDRHQNKMRSQHFAKIERQRVHRSGWHRLKVIPINLI